MEHVVQFGVSVDDSRIEDAVVKAAADAVMKAFRERRGYYDSRDGMLDANSIIERCVREKLDGIEDQILEVASEKLVESMRRTKKYKEAIDRAAKEFQEA